MDIASNNVLIAFVLTAIAGLSTGIGSVIALFAKKTNRKFLSFSLGFSAGVMIYVSFVDLFPMALGELGKSFEGRTAALVTTLGFFGGILLAAVIDKLVPSVENPHEPRSVESMQVEIEPHDTPERNVKHRRSNNRIMRTGIITALVIAIHNFPEGIATFMSAIQDPHVGIAIALAISIHNIPEGIAVSVPVYYATGSRKKAFTWSFLSGLAEPLGAVIAYLVLAPFLTPVMLGIIFAAIAGIMVFISLDELLPAAREYGEHHTSIWGLIMGMAVMAVGILVIL